VAVVFYKLVKGLEYESVNPDAEKAEEEGPDEGDSDRTATDGSREDSAADAEVKRVPKEHPTAPTANPSETVRNNKRYNRNGSGGDDVV